MIDLTIETGDKFKKSLLKIQRWCFICGVSTIPVMTGPLKFPIAGNQVAYIFITIGVKSYISLGIAVFSFRSSFLSFLCKYRFESDAKLQKLILSYEATLSKSVRLVIPKRVDALSCIKKFNSLCCIIISNLFLDISFVL